METNIESSVFVHESAYVDEGATIGAGTKVWHFSHVMSGAQIGSQCSFGQNVNVAGSVVVGNGCRVQNNVSLYDGVILDDGVFCGPSCVFTNDFTPRARFAKGPSGYLGTHIMHDASIGANATIVCGNTIHPFALIGAGAVVNKDVPAHALMVGVPARQIGWVCECGTKLSQNLVCPDCGMRFELGESGLSRVEE